MKIEDKISVNIAEQTKSIMKKVDQNTNLDGAQEDQDKVTEESVSLKDFILKKFRQMEPYMEGKFEAVNERVLSLDSYVKSKVDGNINDLTDQENDTQNKL